MEKREEISCFRGYFEAINTKIDSLKARDLLILAVGFVTFLKINRKIERLEREIEKKNLE